MDTSKQSAAELNAVYGGTALVVKNKSGEAMSVTIRKVTIAEMPNYYGLLDNDIAHAAYLIGEEESTIQSLEDDAIFDIVEAGLDLNFTLAQRWAKKRERTISLQLAAIPEPERNRLLGSVQG